MPADQAVFAVYYAALSPWCEIPQRRWCTKNRLYIFAAISALNGGHARQSAKIRLLSPPRSSRPDDARRVKRKCLVNGVPLLETEFASDPKTPIVSSRIAEIAALQSEIPAQPCRMSGRRLSAYRGLCGWEGEGIIVVDAVEERDPTLTAQVRKTTVDAAARRRSHRRMRCRLNFFLCKTGSGCRCWWWPVR